MPHTHHTHSSTFCQHASSPLSEMLSTFKTRNFKTVCLTEHMPRTKLSDLYPEEVASGTTVQDLWNVFDEYVRVAGDVVQENRREITSCRPENENKDDTQQRVSSQTTFSTQKDDSHDDHQQPPQLPQESMQILLGFEAEWMRPSDANTIETLLKRNNFDMWIGSIHHVFEIPIDFSQELFDKAALEATKRREDMLRSLHDIQPINDCSDEDALFAAYFDAQCEMLQCISPPVLGHFDLISLFARRHVDYRDRHGSVFSKAMHALVLAKQKDCILEINTAGWRKGLEYPYPRPEIVSTWVKMKGRICLSDDSHGISHIATNYDRLLGYLRECGVHTISRLVRAVDGRVKVEDVSLDDVSKDHFWAAVGS